MVCPTCCPATPFRIAVYPCLPCPPTEGGGGDAPHRGERWTTLSLTPLPHRAAACACPCACSTAALQHPAAPNPALQHPAAPVRRGVGGHLDSAQPEAALQPPAARGPGRRGITLRPCCPHRCSERGRDVAKNVHQARAPPSLPPAPTTGCAHGKGGGGGDAVAGCTAIGGFAHNHRPPGDMRPEPPRLFARGWDYD